MTLFVSRWKIYGSRALVALFHHFLSPGEITEITKSLGRKSLVCFFGRIFWGCLPCTTPWITSITLKRQLKLLGPVRWLDRFPNDAETAGYEARDGGSHSEPIHDFVAPPRPAIHPLASNVPCYWSTSTLSVQWLCSGSHDGTHISHPGTCPNTRCHSDSGSFTQQQQSQARKFSASRWAKILEEGHIRICPLVNLQKKTMENHHLSMGISTYINYCYVSLPEGNGLWHPWPLPSDKTQKTYCQGAQSPNATPAISKGTLQKNAWKTPPT